MKKTICDMPSCGKEISGDNELAIETSGGTLEVYVSYAGSNCDFDICRKCLIELLSPGSKSAKKARAEV